MRKHLLDAYHAAISAADPEEATYLALASEVSAPATVLAIGKAAGAMTRGAARALGPIEGLAVSDHHEDLPEGLDLMIGDHPLPGEASLAAGRALLASAAGARGTLVALVSGGGSALAEVPAGDLTIRDLASAQDGLMRAGAGISELNRVRRHLSRLKNGGLLTAARVPTVTLLISDVIDGPASDIASGPTLADTSLPEDALGVVQKYRLEKEHPSIIDYLSRAAPPPPATVPHRHQVVAGGEIAARAAAHLLAERGQPNRIITLALRGEATAASRNMMASLQPGIIGIATGETTVRVTGGGRGGRNQHAALAVALDIAGTEAVFAALGTDGRDGPTDAAGAIVDGGTLDRLSRAGLDPRGHLESCNSYPALDAAGDLIRTGPTGTNVGDLWMAWKLF